MAHNHAFLYSRQNRPMFMIRHENFRVPELGSEGWFVSRCAKSGLWVPYYVFRDHCVSDLFPRRLALLNKLPKIDIAVRNDGMWSYEQFMEKG